jgi:hypothetical protein
MGSWVPYLREVSGRSRRDCSQLRLRLLVVPAGRDATPIRRKLRLPRNILSNVLDCDLGESGLVLSMGPDADTALTFADGAPIAGPPRPGPRGPAPGAPIRSRSCAWDLGTGSGSHRDQRPARSSCHRACWPPCRCRRSEEEPSTHRGHRTPAVARVTGPPSFPRLFDSGWPSYLSRPVQMREADLVTELRSHL